MKRYIFLIILLLGTLHSCKKDTVDSTNLKTFQSSINDMTSGLKTLQQVKFNEALYILKTFGVEADGDTYELTALSKLIAGKNVPQILAMADEVAVKNGIAWSSTGPPSLGELNVFGEETLQETNPNDITAAGLDILVKETYKDSLAGPVALQVIPRLVDRQGNPIRFEGAALETTMEISSGGTKIKTAKNLMQNNQFTGFPVRFNTIPAAQISNESIDISVAVKTAKKTYRMSKLGIPVNKIAFKQPAPATPSVSPTAAEDPLQETPTTTPDAENPNRVVQQFLRNVSAQNLEAAYQLANNPNWSSYDKFANPTTGFGSVKNVQVKKITPANVTDNTASIQAVYDVTDENGNSSTVNVNFGLQNVNGMWKISSYKIQ